MDFQTFHSIEETLHVLAERGDEMTLLAGGTDVMVQMDRGEVTPERLGYIGRLSELTNVKRNNNKIELGALTNHRTIAESGQMMSDYKAVTVAAAQVGGWQTQYAGTIGGNLCNASPAADLIPPLLVHQATLTLLSQAGGERTLSLNQFLLGRRQTAREPDELLTGIFLETPPPNSADIYLKVGRRSAMEVAIVGLAIRLTLSEDDNAVSDICVATCAVGPIPRRAVEVETVLSGQCLTAEIVKEAGEVLAETSVPIDDVRGSARYRLMVLPGLLERAVSRCSEIIIHKKQLVQHGDT